MGYLRAAGSANQLSLPPAESVIEFVVDRIGGTLEVCCREERFVGIEEIAKESVGRD